MWELSGRELPAQLCFAWQVPSPSSPLQVLMQGIVSPNLLSRFVPNLLEQLPLHAEELSQTKLVLLEWPRSTTAPALSHTGACLPSVHSPKQHIPVFSSSRQLSSVSPAPPAFTSGCSSLTSPLLSTDMSIPNAFLLFGGIQVLQPCFINIPVSP